MALVTGASGFIGRVLCARLKRDGIGVRAVMRRPGPGPWDDARAMDLGVDQVPSSLLEGVDTIFHLAGKAHAVSELTGEDEEHYRITVEGTRRLLAATLESSVARFVFFSSVKAMGEGGELCQDEDTECRPETPYGVAKLRAEKMVKESGDSCDLHAVIFRLPVVYGAGSKGNLSRMIKSMAASRFPPLPDTGNKRSMVHVDDVAQLAIRVSECPRSAGQTYLVTDGKLYSTREIYQMMCEALGKSVPSWSMPLVALRMAARMGDIYGGILHKRFPIDSDALKKLTASAIYSSAKVEREVGFKATCTLRDALPEMVVQLRSEMANEKLTSCCI